MVGGMFLKSSQAFLLMYRAAPKYGVDHIAWQFDEPKRICVGEGE